MVYAFHLRDLLRPLESKEGNNAHFVNTDTQIIFHFAEPEPRGLN